MLAPPSESPANGRGTPAADDKDRPARRRSVIGTPHIVVSGAPAAQTPNSRHRRITVGFKSAAQEAQQKSRFRLPWQRREGVFPGNKVSTAKYQVWNFIPKTLIEQFMRLANIYFLVIAILQVRAGESAACPC